MYCTNCGFEINDGSRFCPKCGKTAILDSPPPPPPMALNSNMNNTGSHRKRSIASFVFGLFLTTILGAAAIYVFIKLKTDIVGWIIAIGILLISGVLHRFLAIKGLKFAMIIFSISLAGIVTSFAFTTDLGNGELKSLFNPGSVITGNTDDDSGPSGSNAGTGIGEGEIEYGVSSVVSIGTNRDDLGNIINGQYFFDDGDNQYYSSFDKNSVPHIYKVGGTGKATSIFDGFGWSLVTYGDWLYFSGNEGTAIDGSYNLFRIKTDGSEKDLINSGFCYNMSFYKEWLYYIKKADYSSTSYSFCRSKLDGSGEEVVIPDGGNCGVIYEHRIYFMDSGGNVCSANPDGNGSTVLIQGPISYFIIGNGSIIYLDANANIMKAAVDGSGVTTIRQTGEKRPHTINSYKDTILYTYYDSQYVSGRYAYQYYLNSIKLDGSGDREIYTGVSYGFYINVLNDMVYVLDYAVDPSSGVMIAVARNMGLDGSNAGDLYR